MSVCVIFCTHVLILTSLPLAFPLSGKRSVEFEVDPKDITLECRDSIYSQWLSVSEENPMLKTDPFLANFFNALQQVSGPLRIKTLGGNEYLVHDWINAQDIKELTVAQHPDLEATVDSFDLLTYDDVMIDPKIETPSREAMRSGEYGTNLILLFRDKDEIAKNQAATKTNPEEVLESQKSKPSNKIKLTCVSDDATFIEMIRDFYDLCDHLIKYDGVNA